MYYFKIPIPSSEKDEYEARLIKCHKSNQQWCYTIKNSYAEDALVPDVPDIPIYQVEGLNELILLAHSEQIERNGLTILCVPKGTMALISSVKVKR